MAMCGASRQSAAPQALTVFSVLAVVVADVAARHHVCPHFSCGALSNISYPFRRQGDAAHCGPYELVCTDDTNATIRIGSGTYYLVSINYTASYFWVVDTNMRMQNSCPLPRWDDHAYYGRHGSDRFVSTSYPWMWAIFVNCSQEINDSSYGLLDHCLSTPDSFIYVLFKYDDYYHPSSASAWNFKPSCGYLAVTPLDNTGMVPEDYEDVVKLMRKGFPLPFPFNYSIRKCFADAFR
jgi:hypothetical protein